MFGHQDDQHHHHDGDNQPINDVLSQPAVDTMVGAPGAPGMPGGQFVSDDDAFNPALPMTTNGTVYDTPGSGYSNNFAAAAPGQNYGGFPAQPQPSMPTAPVSTAQTAPITPAGDGGGDLLGIKQQALTELSPLVGHLEQTAEEKFRTTMMMIQASDNQDLIGAAYEAAQAITDEKAKAQALLDVINEINYFTAQANQQPQA